MEKELNIAAILKDKPAELKLYSPTYGYIRFNGVHKGRVYFYSEDTNAHSVKQNGKMYDDGECIIFPSKSMRSWEKFAWKKGDVLYSAGLKEYCIFNKFVKDNYVTFISKYNVDEILKRVVPKTYDPDKNTADYEKVSDENAAEIISLIEEFYGGKLNLETLQIEQPKQEFKDGDIVTHEERNHIYILEKWDSIMDRIFYHVCLDTHSSIGLDCSCGSHHLEYPVIRLATESEKQQLFDALAKENKVWDAEKKAIVDLPKKCEFKPFQKVMVRDSKDEEWRPAFFWREHSNGCEYVILSGEIYNYCIPYNDQTKHLLGTTDEWKGGEG